MISEEEEFFKLYVEIAKTQLKQLPNSSDRIIGTKWISLFISITNPDEFKERDHFLKLFITSLGSKCLVGPFTNPPDPIEPFKIKLKPTDIRKLILKLKSKNYPYFVEFSKNLFEYSVCQEHNFGAQIFYGFSIEPIPIWSSSENAILKTGNVEGVEKVSLPNVSFFESKKGEEELSAKRKIGKILTSTRITPPNTKAKEPSAENSPAKTNPKIPVRLMKRQQAFAASIEEEVTPDLNSEEVDETVLNEIPKPKIPKNLLKRLQENYAPISKEERLLQTPTIFKTGPKRKGPYIKYRPEEFGIDKDEKFQPAKPLLRNLQWTPSKRDGRIQIRDIMNLPKQQNMESTRIEKEIPKIEDENEIENSFDRSYRKMMEKLHREKPKKSQILSPRSQSLYDRIQSTRIEPKKLEFHEQYPEEEEVNLNYSRLEYQELPDGYSSDDDQILNSDEMDSEGLFDDDQLEQPITQLGVSTKTEVNADPDLTIFSQSLQNRFEALKAMGHVTEDPDIDDILNSFEMDTEDLFVDDQLDQFVVPTKKLDPGIKYNESLKRKLAEVKSLADERNKDQILHESLIENLYPEPTTITPKNNEITEYDKELNEENDESSSDDEHLKSYELDELFGFEDEDEAPVPVRDIPIPIASTSSYQRRHINVLEKPGPRPQKTQLKPILDSFNLADESLPAEILQLTKESLDSILGEHEMDTGDLFAENNIMAPSDVISPEKMAILTSIAQTRKLNQLQRKLRAKRGEEQIPEEAEAVQQIMEEDLMYPTKFKNFIDTKTLLDRTLDRQTLPAPLIRSPQKVKYQPFAEYEVDADEHYNYVAKPNVSQHEHFQSYEINELYGYDDEAEDPVPVREIPIVQKTPSPKKQRVNHLGKLTPMTKTPLRYNFESDRNIADESMPGELDESQKLPEPIQSTPLTFRDLRNQLRERRGETPVEEEEEPPVIQKIENRLAVEELIAQIDVIEKLPAPQVVEILSYFEKDLDDYYNVGSLEEHLEEYEIDELLGFDDEMEEPVNLGAIPMPQKPVTPKKQRIDYLLKTQPLPAKEPKRIDVGSDSELEDESINLEESVISQQSLLNENEMNISDMFAAENLMNPRNFTSPKKMAIEMSKAQSNQILSLINRFRVQKGEAIIEAPQEFQENITDNDLLAEYQRRLEADEILNFKSPVPKAANVLNEFDRDLDEYYQNDEKQEHLQSFEVDELAAYDEEGEDPLPLNQIPFETPKQKTPSPKKRATQKPPRYFDHPSDEDFVNPEEMEYLYGDRADEFAKPVAVQNIPISLPKRFREKREYLSFLGEPKRVQLPIVTGDDDLEMEEAPSFLELIVGNQTAPVKYSRADKSLSLEEFGTSKDVPDFLKIFVGEKKTPIKYVQLPGPEILRLKNQLEKIKTKTPTPIKESSYSPNRSNEPFQASTPLTVIPKTNDYLQFNDEIGSPVKHLEFISPPKNFERSFDRTSPERPNPRRRLFSQSKRPSEEHTTSKQDKLIDRFKEIAEASPAQLDEQNLNLDSDYSGEEIKELDSNRPPRIRTRRALYNLTDDEEVYEEDEELSELEYDQANFAWLGNYRPTTPSPPKNKNTKKLDPRVELTKRKDDQRKLEEMKRIPTKKTVPIKKAVPVKKKTIKKR